jgi:hypothetical protein
MFPWESIQITADYFIHTQLATDQVVSYDYYNENGMPCHKMPTTVTCLLGPFTISLTLSLCIEA